MKMPLLKFVEIPLSESDLQTYFFCDTAQLLSFFIKNYSYKGDHELKTKFETWRDQIVGKIIETVSRN